MSRKKNNYVLTCWIFKLGIRWKGIQNPTKKFYIAIVLNSQSCFQFSLYIYH